MLAEDESKLDSDYANDDGISLSIEEGIGDEYSMKLKMPEKRCLQLWRFQRKL